jgi:hypothetical protein
MRGAGFVAAANELGQLWRQLVGADQIEAEDLVP